MTVFRNSSTCVASGALPEATRRTRPPRRDLTLAKTIASASGAACTDAGNNHTEVCPDIIRRSLSGLSPEPMAGKSQPPGTPPHVLPVGRCSIPPVLTYMLSRRDLTLALHPLMGLPAHSMHPDILTRSSVVPCTSVATWALPEATGAHDFLYII